MAQGEDPDQPVGAEGPNPPCEGNQGHRGSADGSNPPSVTPEREDVITSGANGPDLGYTDVGVRDLDRQAEDSGVGPSAENQSESESSANVSDLKYPTPASDLFCGADTIPQASDEDTLVQTSTLSAIAKRQTSLSGTPGLDMLSQATLLSQEGILSLGAGQNEASYANNQTERQPLAVSSPMNRAPVANDCTDKQPLAVNSPRNEASFVKDGAVKQPLSVKTSRNRASFANDSTGNQPFVVTSALNELQFSTPKENDWSLEESFEPFIKETPLQTTDVNEVPFCVSQVSDTPSESSSRLLTEAEIHRCQVKSGAWLDPQYPNFTTVALRIATFPTDATLDGMAIDSRQFAESGFFYKVKENVESVICYHCGCSPKGWNDEMDPRIEHIILSPRCRAVFP